MMRNIFNRSPLIAVAIVLTSLMTLGQTGGKSYIDERNVRSGMGFLASDAMQGRGSGTMFERIAAEYVGSQFMQFGLEPAGDSAYEDRRGYVKNISINTNSYASAPTLRFGSTTWEHGREMVVIRTNAATLSGEFRKVALTDRPERGTAAFVSMGDLGTGQNLMRSLQTILSGDASIVIVEETAQTRSAWSAIGARPITWTSTWDMAKQSAVVVVSKQAAAEISGLPTGTKIDFGGALAPVQTRNTWNALGKLTGKDKTQSAEVIVLSSHLDHIGVRENAPGDDKINNGADDDASGTVAVIELARVFARGKRPKRTIYFVCFGSEESGGLGSRNFADNLPFPQEKFVANLQFEMIGRPDAKVKADELWLTGYERSNLGSELAKHGAKLVQDPHPDQNFFQRSDNYALARKGIIAHTVSSFGLHKDYHQPSDEIKTIDFMHMTRSINTMVKPIEWLANVSFIPVWIEGKRP